MKIGKGKIHGRLIIESRESRGCTIDDVIILHLLDFRESTYEITQNLLEEHSPRTITAKSRYNGYNISRTPSWSRCIKYYSDDCIKKHFMDDSWMHWRLSQFCNAYEHYIYTAEEKDDCCLYIGQETLKRWCYGR